MDEFRQSFSEFAQEKRPSNPEVARVLRAVRRSQQRPKSPAHLWLLGVSGWVVAAVCLGLLAKQANELRSEPEALIQSDPDRVLRSPRAPAALPPPPQSAASEPTPVAPVFSAPAPQRRVVPPPPRLVPVPSAPEGSSSPEPSAAAPIPSALPPVAPRLAFDQSLLLARSHLFRIESLIEVIRESGTGARLASEQRCFAAQHQRLLGLRGSAQEQLQKIETAARGGDAPSLDLELERLLGLRQSADAVYREARLCIGAR